MISTAIAIPSINKQKYLFPRLTGSDFTFIAIYRYLIIFLNQESRYPSFWLVPFSIQKQSQYCFMFKVYVDFTIYGWVKTLHIKIWHDTPRSLCTRTLQHCSTAGDPAPCHLDRSRGLGLGQGPPVNVGDEARSLAWPDNIQPLLTDNLWSHFYWQYHIKYQEIS